MKIQEKYKFYNKNLALLLLLFVVGLAQFVGQSSNAFAQTISAIKVEGNTQVESEAILSLMKSQVGKTLDKKSVAQDIREIWNLGYFSDVRFSSKADAKGLSLTVTVKEKPAIVAIEFEGNEEIQKTKLEEKLETKIFTIVNEETIASDIRTLEKQYAEDGFYLARVRYQLVTINEKEVKLVFQIEEGGKVKIADVFILGNEFFSDYDLIDKIQTKPLTRPRAFTPTSLYQEEAVELDLQRLSYLYRDFGFAEVKVGKPYILLDNDRSYVRITYQIEEGVQYSVNKIEFQGDLLFTPEELREKMLLKPNELFRISRFQKDVEMITDKYGDLGYAYADINPVPVFDKEKKLVDLTFNITKGDKVYFGETIILGNSKTRDNVIRREMDVADTELYSGTKLSDSRRNINRLGFFEEIQIIKEREEGRSDLLNLQIKVKEKPTGQLQAAMGFAPGTGTAESSWFGQGRYDEKNQFGKGWATNLTGRWNGGENFSFDIGFSEPRIDDGPWSFGINAFYAAEVTKLFEDVTSKEVRYGTTVRIGRKVIELIRASIAYSISRLTQESDVFLSSRFQEEGITSSVTLALRRNSTDSYLEPTEGSDIGISQTFAGGPVLKGDFEYLESKLDATTFVPIDFTEEYRTYFRLHGDFSYIFPNGDENVPFIRRYRLGGYNDLRGYDFRSVGPKFRVLRNPGESFVEYPKGGDKSLLFQMEYFFPFFPEAGIKGLLFSDAGRVYDDNESVEFKDFKYDVGFGFRWLTPIAPFRFEWAYPVENGKMGDVNIIFYIGF